jgi:RNA polymerase sigma-70 factor (ECF subfamily)
MEEIDDPRIDPLVRADVAAVLVANHRQFLAFLERRVGDRQTAEDILQESFVRGLEKAEALRSDEAAIGWFYRVLRNRVIDYHRRTAARSRGLEALASELETHEGPSEAIHEAICRCVSTLAETLKPEYATALRRIEIDGVSVKDYAIETGISASNAGVRVFLAREALRKQLVRSCGTCADHGCLDCTCETSNGHRRGCA